MRIPKLIYRCKSMTNPQFTQQNIPNSINFVTEEENILQLWKDINAFKTSETLSRNRKPFSFFDGPPFATGLPHYGHILAGTIKDIITRYAYQTNHHVVRRFGWDCHGLPIEHEIDKLYHIKTPNDIEKLGIAKYNELCRGIVMRYAHEWDTIVSRTGRWIDFENDYKTMYPEYMESVWWVFKQLFTRELVYRSFRVMPYSTACTTPLSNFETSQNFKEVSDPSIIVKFRVIGKISIGITENSIENSCNYTKINDNKHNYTKSNEKSNENTKINENNGIGKKINEDDRNNTKNNEKSNENTNINENNGIGTKINEDDRNNTKINDDKRKYTKNNEKSNKNTNINDNNGIGTKINEDDTNNKINNHETQRDNTKNNQRFETAQNNENNKNTNINDECKKNTKIDDNKRNDAKNNNKCQNIINNNEKQRNDTNNSEIYENVQNNNQNLVHNVNNNESCRIHTKNNGNNEIDKSIYENQRINTNNNDNCTNNPKIDESFENNINNNINSNNIGNDNKINNLYQNLNSNDSINSNEINNLYKNLDNISFNSNNDNSRDNKYDKCLNNDNIDDEVYFLAWTTTPWTLPSHMALVVHPDKQYVRIRCKKTNAHYILMKNRLEFIFKNDTFEIICFYWGRDLVGIKYHPPFNYYNSYISNNLAENVHNSHQNTHNSYNNIHISNKNINIFDDKFPNAFSICADTYVTDDSGTGIVHSAPAFGQDDLRVCVENNVISGNSPPCPIDVAGFFTDPVSHYKGMYFKDADPLIIKDLKSRGLIFNHSTHSHSYPFCWRSDTPIMYRAVPSWFIKVESFVSDLLNNNTKSKWVPDYVRSRRFNNWLETARDWNVSRNRYWGTPIPLWVSEDFEEIVCIGSIQELYELSGVKVTDLHRENIDHILIPSKKGKGFLKRTPEVFDCWFESGSMPYAQIHYPFENKERFNEYFPADFVAEGIDQTRGWFYTLLVISTALFNDTPFKNVIVSGLVLAADGEKMSKRKKNYPDVMEMVNKYGADCIRCYLMNSPAVNGENLRFKESGLSDLTKELFLPWFNAFRFFHQYKSVYENENNVKFTYELKNLSNLESLVDQWMLSYTQSFIKKYREEMGNYKLYNVLPNIQAYIDTLTKWYIRINRLNLKGDAGSHLQSLTVLYHCLLKFCITVAPVCPFICEYYFQHLKNSLTVEQDESYKSVHFQMIPEIDEKFINSPLETNFSNFRSMVELARSIREKNNLPMKHPLSRLVIVHPEKSYLENLKKLEMFILEDLNVKEVEYTSDHSLYGLQLSIIPNFKLLGKRLGKDLKGVIDEINSFSQEKLLDCLKKGQIEVRSYEISSEEIRVCFKISSKEVRGGKYDVETQHELAVLLDTKPDSKLEDEGVARDFVNKIQRLRKQAKLNPIEEIIIYYTIIKSKNGDADLIRALDNNSVVMQNIIKKPINRVDKDYKISSEELIMNENFELMNTTVSLSLVRSNKQ